MDDLDLDFYKLLFEDLDPEKIRETSVNEPLINWQDKSCDQPLAKYNGKTTIDVIYELVGDTQLDELGVERPEDPRSIWITGMSPGASRCSCAAFRPSVKTGGCSQNQISSGVVSLRSSVKRCMACHSGS